MHSAAGPPPVGPRPGGAVRNGDGEEFDRSLVHCVDWNPDPEDVWPWGKT